MESKEKHEKFLEVTVNTTAGSYPEDGAERVPSHQKVRVLLKKAEEHLGITNSDGWVATANVDGQNKNLNIDAAYSENGLSGTVDIDYGPEAGGGGNA